VYFKRDWFSYYSPLEVNLDDFDVNVYIDPAISQDQDSDNTAILTVGRNKKNNFLYALDIDF
jgi:hypothetical protein